MGGETPARAGLGAGPGDPGERSRRLALVRLAVGVPALLLVLFGVVLGFRLAGRSLGDPLVWWVLGPVVGAFALYFGCAILRLRRAPSGGVEGPTSERE